MASNAGSKLAIAEPQPRADSATFAAASTPPRGLRDAGVAPANVVAGDLREAAASRTRRPDATSLARCSMHERSNALAHHWNSLSAFATAVISAASMASCDSSVVAAPSASGSVSSGCSSRSSLAQHFCGNQRRASVFPRAFKPAGHVEQHVQRVAKAARHAAAAISCSRRVPTVRCAAPADARQGCRCRPSKRTAAAMASASAYHTNCKSGRDSRPMAAQSVERLSACGQEFPTEQ